MCALYYTGYANSDLPRRWDPAGPRHYPTAALKVFPGRKSVCAPPVRSDTI